MNRACVGDEVSLDVRAWQERFGAVADGQADEDEPPPLLRNRLKQQAGRRPVAPVVAITVAAMAGLYAVLDAHADSPTVALWGGKDQGMTYGPRFLQAATCNVSQCESAGYTCEPPAAEKAVGFVILEWALIVLLVSLSAMFSGLTLGLMSLDKIGLEIVIGGNPESKDARYAKIIQPIREHGNLLLCTLLLGNVMVNAALSILLADYTSGIVGFILSTSVIVIFGEILPQAGCSRHALWVGAHTVWLVKVFIVILFPLAKPVSMFLDFLFKEDIGTIYSSSQLNKLVQIHLKHQMVSEDQAKMMGGALAYKDKTVSNVMTNKEGIFMLEMNEVLDFKTMTNIFQAGYSRIPVCDGNDRNKIVGILFTKDLILIDPEDNTSVKSVVQFFGRPVHYLWPETKLSEAMALFRSGRTHLALVQKVNNEDEERDPFYEIVGLVTLEDIIEEILQEEILDETDSPVLTNTAVTGRESFDRATFDFARLRLLDTKNHNNLLSADEVSAIVAHLAANVSMFEGALKRGEINQNQLRGLVCSLPVLHLKFDEKLYIKGKPMTHCTLVLSGKMDITSGTEGFRSSVGPWSLVGQSALNLEVSAGSIGDFSATVTSEEGLRCLRISRYNFESMISQNKLGDTVDVKAVHSSSARSVISNVVPSEPAEETAKVSDDDSITSFAGFDDVNKKGPESQ